MTNVRTMTVEELLKDAAVCHEYDGKPCLCGQCEAARELARRAALWERVQPKPGGTSVIACKDGGLWFALIDMGRSDKLPSGDNRMCPTAREAVEKALEANDE